MSARTIIENSDDEASDIEQEHGREEIPVADASLNKPLNCILSGGTEARDAISPEQGWLLPPTMQQIFNEHRPDMMFSQGSSTVPNTTMTQQQIARGLHPEIISPPRPAIEAAESQKSKSSLGWSDLLKSQGLESLARSQDAHFDETNLVQEEQKYETNRPTEDCQGRIEESRHVIEMAPSRAVDEQLNLLPVHDTYTPPGTPKLLDLGLSYMARQETMDQLKATEIEQPEQRIPDATPGTIEHIMNLLAGPKTPVQAVERTCKRKLETGTGEYWQSADNEKQPTMTPLKASTPLRSASLAEHVKQPPATKRQKRSKSGPTVVVGSIQEPRVPNDANQRSSSTKKRSSRQLDSATALFAPDIADGVAQTDIADFGDANEVRGQEALPCIRPQVVVQVQSRREAMPEPTMLEPNVGRSASRKKGRGRPKKQHSDVSDEVKTGSGDAVASNAPDENKHQRDHVEEPVPTNIIGAAVELVKEEPNDSKTDAVELFELPNSDSLPDKENMRPSCKPVGAISKTGLSSLKSLTPYRVGLSRRTRIPSLLKTMRK